MSGDPGPAATILIPSHRAMFAIFVTRTAFLVIFDNSLVASLTFNKLPSRARFRGAVMRRRNVLARFSEGFGSSV
ncbi:hypothetical protein N431DRAFT_437981 [Stipitochalara longipes BDJ]|nr:hypothetical protein N431DRAFT_437981 [Stipitochalara longipes BDJ]